MNDSRRKFLKRMGVLAGGAAISACASPAAKSILRSPYGLGAGERPETKLIFIAVDSLHPNYLNLDSHGQPGGREGNWLMPNLRRFLGRAVWFPNAECYLPSATDTNHLNALAGTSAGQTGIIGVKWQFERWDSDGEPVLATTHLSQARDDLGRPVDTLFHAWKRRWPSSTTAFISGKGWVAEMFETPESPAVDTIVTGSKHPPYLKKPPKERFADPPTDEDAECDPRTPFKKRYSLSTGIWEGQAGLLTRVMEYKPDIFPHDGWIVDAALQVFERENPDLAYILMAQADDAGHGLGAAWNPREFVTPAKPYVPPEGCRDAPEYQRVSSRNVHLFLDPILDSVRDTDFHFGRLLEGLEARGALKNAFLVVLSDHSMINHLHVDSPATTDFWGKLEEAGLAKKEDCFAFAAASAGAVFWREGKQRAEKAKTLLMEHLTKNRLTGREECPWWILDRNDMRAGVEGVCLPGELYHPYFIEAEAKGTAVWPNLMILAKNGWQLPTYAGSLRNTGMALPTWLPPMLPFNGGHGSVDTLPITAAIARPKGASRVCDRKIRIADLAVTAASFFRLELKSTVIGKDLQAELS